MEYIIKLFWDGEASVWIADNDEIPIVLESESLDTLVKRVQLAVPEMIELNNKEPARTLLFTIQVPSGAVL